MGKRKIIIVAGAVVAVAILSVLSYFVFFKTDKTEVIEDASNNAESLNKSATEGVLDVDANPLKNAPNTNPVEKANPYSDVKTNPFD